MKFRAFILMLIATTVNADYISGDMTLRDAIYIYDQDLYSSRDLALVGLVGVYCDIFELVIDLDSGYTDLEMAEWQYNFGDTTFFIYPDRIYAPAKMFAYTLYKNVWAKQFGFFDYSSPEPFRVIGKGTIFGYCFSTDPRGEVGLFDWHTCTSTYSDGTWPIPNCIPTVVRADNKNHPEDASSPHYEIEKLIETYMESRPIVE